MTTVLKWVHLVSGKLNDVIEFLITTALFVLFCITVFEVGGRYFFGYSYPWIPEAAGFLMACIAFMGVSCLVYRRSLLAVDIFRNRFPALLRYAVDILSWMLLIFYARIFVVSGYDFAQRAAGQLTPSQFFQLTHVRMIIPIAGTIIIYHALCNLLTDIVKAASHKSNPEHEAGVCELN